MAHYAFIDDNNIVTEVIVGKDESELIDGLTPEEWYAAYRNQPCVRTSYNSNIRGVFAGIGMSYNETEDIFVTVQPFASWVRVGSFWQAPTPMPTTPGVWTWSEETLSWID